MYNQQDPQQNDWSPAAAAAAPRQQQQGYDFQQFMRDNDPNAAARRGQESSDSSNYSASAGVAALPTPASPRVEVNTGPRRGTTSNGATRRATYSTQNLTAAAAAAKPPPGVGMGIMEDMNGSIPSMSSDSESNRKPAARQTMDAPDDFSETSISLAAPYQNMLQQQQWEDPTVARARHSMASIGEIKQKQLPLPDSAPPQRPPTDQQSVEPTIPFSRLGRRCLTHKPKREPELVKGLVVRNNASSGSSSTKSKVFVTCSNCLVTMQISKNAVAVSCPSCYQIKSAASCIVQGRS